MPATKGDHPVSLLAVYRGPVVGTLPMLPAAHQFTENTYERPSAPQE